MKKFCKMLVLGSLTVCLVGGLTACGTPKTGEGVGMVTSGAMTVAKEATKTLNEKEDVSGDVHVHERFIDKVHTADTAE